MNPLSLSLAFLLLLAPIVDGWLGVYLDPDQTKPVVVEVIPGSPAARAGLRAGDELLAVGEQATPTREDLVAAIRGRKAGEQLRLKLRRDGKEQVVDVTLGEAQGRAVPAPAEGAAPPERGRPPVPSVEVAPVRRARDAAGKPYLGLRVRQADGGGVVVDEALPDGPAAALGIRAGESITQLGDRSIGSLADLDEVLARSEAGQKLAIGLASKNGARSLTITLGAAPGAKAPVPPQAPTPPVARPPKQLAPAPAQPKPPAADGYDLEREIEALRRELRELRQQLEEMRRQPAPKGRE